MAATESQHSAHSMSSEGYGQINDMECVLLTLSAGASSFCRLRMEYIDFLQIISEVFPFVWSQNPQRKADERPEVNHRIITTVMLTEFMNLSVAVMTPGNAVVRAGRLDLLIFQTTIRKALFFEPGLQKAAAAAAAVVVGTVRLHVNEILFPHYGLDYEAQIFGNGIPIAFTNDLTGILNRKLDFQIFVPVGIDFQSAFTNPFGIVLINVFNFKIMFDIEFFQSGPD